MLNGRHGAELHGRIERVLRKYTHADLLVIDDFASLEMDTAQAKLAFQVISERYHHRRSTAIATNRAFKEWPKDSPDPLNAQVIAERLSERCEHFVLTKGFPYPDEHLTHHRPRTGGNILQHDQGLTRDSDKAFLFRPRRIGPVPAHELLRLPSSEGSIITIVGPLQLSDEQSRQHSCFSYSDAGGWAWVCG